MNPNNLVVSRVLQVREPSAKRLGLDRLEEDKLVLAFAIWAEGQIKRWVDYAKGALLFLMVPGNPESGMFYVFDRARQTFWMLDLAEAGRYCGYRLDEFDHLVQAYGLKAFAQEPRLLPVLHCETFENGEAFGV
ncbi:MAG: hypothetical protein LC130_25570 [Bryobacterales bacterium]|nr:hypothetical protein [Bryobacterales bacterium]